MIYGKKARRLRSRRKFLQACKSHKEENCVTLTGNLVRGNIQTSNKPSVVTGKQEVRT